MKKALITMYVILCFIISIQSAYAKDINIILDDTSPSFQQVDNFFNTDDMLWAPGKEETKSLIIQNKTNITQYILFSSINRDDPLLVSQAMHISITNKSGSELYSNSLFAFISQGEKLIGSINSYDTETILFHINMYESAGNKYQNSYVHFDLGIDLLDPTEYVTPVPISCSASPPPSVTQLTLGRIGTNQVLVEWNKEYNDEEISVSNKDAVTGYSIIYSTDSSFRSYTQKYMGKTNQFTASNLDLNTYRYYFKVKSINDCTESDWSSVISIGKELTSTSPPSPTLTPANTSSSSSSGNDSTVDISQSPTPLVWSKNAVDMTNPTTSITKLKTKNENTPLATGQVQGAKTTKCRKYWWQILFLQVMALFLVMFGKHRFKKTRTSIAILTSILIYICYLVINPCLSTKFGFIVVNETWYFNYFWSLDALILMQIILLHKIWRNKNMFR